MAEIKLTKSELRLQQQRLIQLEKYLPTLQLKKAMLQAEVQESRIEILAFEESYRIQQEKLLGYSRLFADTAVLDVRKAAEIASVEKKYENVAGVEVPFYSGMTFADYSYSLFETPPWVDAAVMELRKGVEAEIKIEVAREKKRALEKELREVSIRVNLFEKVLIPRARKNIKKIKIFLGDQQLASVSQAKVAKTKILERKTHSWELDRAS